MNTNPLEQDALPENSAGLGTVTWQMVRVRAEELAVMPAAKRNPLAA